MQGSPRIDELRQKFHENPRRYFAPLANEYRKAGDPEQAIAICRAHLAQQPQHMSGHVVYGQALYDARRADEARTVFEKALTLDPDNAIVLRQLGDIAREKGESAEARHWYAKALDLDPQDSEAAAYLAELEEPLVGVGVPSEAGDTIEAVAEERVEDATPAEEQGDGAEAAPRLESIFVISGDSVVAPPETLPETEALEDAASDDGMPELEELPVPVEEPEPEVEPEPVEEPEPLIESGAVKETDAEPDQPSDTVDEELGRAQETVVPEGKTPQPVASPFVTRTMAELYAEQGYTAAALDVYRQLAIQHPDDSAIRERIEELSRTPSAPEPADEVSLEPENAGAESIYMPDTPALDDSPTEITNEDVWGDLSEAGDEEAFGERVAELDWTDPGFGFGASEPEAPETEPVAELEKREDETESAADSTGVANGARFVEMPVMLGEFQTSIDEAGMASTSPHETEIAPVADKAPEMPATTDAGVEADFRGDEAAAAMAAGHADSPEPVLKDEAGVVAYSPEPPRDEDLPHFTPKIPTVREFFATLGSRKPPAAGNVETFTARAAVPDVPGQLQPQADDLPLATDAFSNLFPGEEIADEDTRAAFALSGALSGTSHNPVPERIQTPPQPQEPVATENRTEESDEELRRFREWLDGLVDS